MKKRILSFILCVAALSSVLTAFQGCLKADSNSIDTTITTVPVTTTEDVTTIQEMTTAVAQQTTTPTTVQVVHTTTQETAITTTVKTTCPVTSTTQEETTTQKVPQIYVYNVDQVADCFADGDVIHVLTKSPNMYMTIDSNTGTVLRNEYLPGVPLYMERIDGKLWISYMSLSSIVVYDEETFEVEDQFYFEFFDMYPPATFDVYGDYLFVAEEDFGVYRYNMKTQEYTQLKGVYCQAGIAIDQSTGLVYIGDSGNSGCKLYCVDAETLEIIGQYIGFEYGIDNQTRKVFVRNDGIYWGAYKLATSDISKVLMEYNAPECYQCGMHYVTDRYLVSAGGFFDRVTGELLMEIDLSRFSNRAVVTDSGNVMCSESGRFYVISNLLP